MLTIEGESALVILFRFNGRAVSGENGKGDGDGDGEGGSK